MSSMYRFRVNLSGSVITGPAVATHYFRAEAGTVGNAHSALAAFWEDLTAVMSEAVSIHCENDVAVIDEVTGAILSVTSVVGFVDVGLSGSGQMSKADQGIVQWRTGEAAGTRELRGHTFVPGMVQAAATLGGPTSSLITALTTAGQTLIDDANSQLVVWSRTHGISHPATIAQSPPYFGVLRSRRD